MPAVCTLVNSCYMTVLLSLGVESNFEKVSSAFSTTQGVPYDYSSVMHYGAYAFSRNGYPTIQPTDPGISLDTLGQRTGLSTFDLEHVNVLYCEESEWKCTRSYCIKYMALGIEQDGFYHHAIM